MVVDVDDVVDVVVDVDVDVVTGVVVEVTADAVVVVATAIDDVETESLVGVASSLPQETMARAITTMLARRRIGFTVGSLARPVAIT